MPTTPTSTMLFAELSDADSDIELLPSGPVSVASSLAPPASAGSASTATASLSLELPAAGALDWGHGNRRDGAEQTEDGEDDEVQGNDVADFAADSNNNDDDDDDGEDGDSDEDEEAAEMGGETAPHTGSLAQPQRPQHNLHGNPLRLQSARGRQVAHRTLVSGRSLRKSEAQVLALERLCAKSPRPSRLEIRALCSNTGLTAKEVRNWIRNRRTLSRRRLAPPQAPAPDSDQPLDPGPGPGQGLAASPSSAPVPSASESSILAVSASSGADLSAIFSEAILSGLDDLSFNLSTPPQFDTISSVTEPFGESVNPSSLAASLAAPAVVETGTATSFDTGTVWQASAASRVPRPAEPSNTQLRRTDGTVVSKADFAKEKAAFCSMFASYPEASHARQELLKGLALVMQKRDKEYFQSKLKRGPYFELAELSKRALKMRSDAAWRELQAIFTVAKKERPSDGDASGRPQQARGEDVDSSEQDDSLSLDLKMISGLVAMFSRRRDYLQAVVRSLNLGAIQDWEPESGLREKQSSAARSSPSLSSSSSSSSSPQPGSRSIAAAAAARGTM